MQKEIPQSSRTCDGLVAMDILDGRMSSKRETLRFIPTFRRSVIRDTYMSRISSATKRNSDSMANLGQLKTLFVFLFDLFVRNKVHWTH